MEHISEEERNSFKPDESDAALSAYKSLDVTAIDEKDLVKVRAEIRDTVGSMIDTAVQIKSYVDQRIKYELSQSNHLSRDLRQWIELYIDLMDRIHRNIYGTKSTQEIKISHSSIASAIRESQVRGKVIDIEHLPDTHDQSKEEEDPEQSDNTD